MADPITWGLLNLIKKRVKGVQTTLDGVSDQVSGLPDSLNTDFTEVKEAVAGVKTDVGAVKNDIESILSNIDVLKSSIDNVYRFTNETNIIVKDILDGNKISEWINDLVTSGTASLTYKDDSAMTTLLGNVDAVNNKSVTHYILRWAISKNKTGDYYSTIVGDVSSVNWTVLTTPNAVMSNGNAFKGICGNEIAFSTTISNANCKQEIFNNYTVTENPIRESSIAISILNQGKTNLGGASNGGYIQRNGFYLTANVWGGTNGYGTCSLYYNDTLRQNYGDDGNSVSNIMKFGTKFSTTTNSALDSVYAYLF